MLNMIDTQDKLKNFSEEQLIREMQMPTGSAPQFMVLSEIERRKRMRSDAQRQEGLMQPTVAQEAVSAAGVPQQGIAQVAQSLAPKTDMTQNTGVSNMQASKLPGQPNQPQRMAEGGIMRLAPGGFVSGGDINAIANFKVQYPDLYEMNKDDPEKLAQLAAKLAANNAEVLQQLGRSESQGLGGYNAQNSEGYVGKYQFGDDRLTDFRDATGQDFTMEQFKANPALQEEVVQWHQKDISDYANDTGLDAYKGQTINGVLINDDSIMAMAHLGGKSGMRQFIESGGEYNPADSNGTTLRDYGMKFGGSSDDEVAQAIMAQKQGLYAPDAIKTTELGPDFNNSATNASGDPSGIGSLGIPGVLDDPTTKLNQTPELSRALSAFQSQELQKKREKNIAETIKAPDIISDPYRALNKETDPSTFDRIKKFAGEMPAPYSLFPYLIDKFGGDEKSETDLEKQNRMQQRQLSGIEALPKEDKSFKAGASKLNQDQWLALAQAGLTLMSTGDYGKAGEAGLSAYKDLTSIQLAKAKAGMRKPVTGAYLTDMRKELDKLIDRRDNVLRKPEKKFGNKIYDPDKVARDKINDQIDALEQAIRQAYGSANINVNPTSSKNIAYDVR
jgi:hypothetical protein